METDTTQKVINACYQFFDYRTYESKQFDSLTVVGKIYNESNVNHTAKPILSIGGPQEPYSSWRNVIANASSIQTFITASMAVLQQYGFQGVDINWQYPKAVDKDKFAVLVEVRLRLIGSTN